MNIDKINNADQARAWFQQLSDDIRADREEVHQTADVPLYYGIQDTVSMPSPSDNGDNIILYDCQSNISIPIEVYFQNLPDAEKEKLANDPFSGISKENDEYCLDDVNEYAHYLDEYEHNLPYQIMYRHNVNILTQNSMFLTRDDADIYREIRSHHYTTDAEVIAMDASACPRYAQLIHLLSTINWKESNLVLNP